MLESTTVDKRLFFFFFPVVSPKRFFFLLERGDRRVDGASGNVVDVDGFSRKEGDVVGGRVDDHVRDLKVEVGDELDGVGGG